VAESGALRVGHSGPEVLRVHDFLLRHGYFPNAQLSAEFPSWRPAVPEAPSTPEVFDEHLEEAVYAFQRMYGLPLTGAVDQTTAAAMAEERCGVPDHVSAEGDKWAVHPEYWGRTSFNWSYNHAGAPSGISESAMITLLTQQFVVRGRFRGKLRRGVAGASRRAGSDVVDRRVLRRVAHARRATSVPPRAASTAAARHREPHPRERGRAVAHPAAHSYL
jgi:peptidoglycan hydrolase-like protein with peptidoglycan-binding domain